MGQHAALRRDLAARAMMSSSSRSSPPITAGSSLAGLMPMQASPRSQQQAVEDRGGDAPGVVEGMVGLQPRAHPPAQADGVAKARRHLRTSCATRIRSWLRISLETAAAISGVMPRASASSTAGRRGIGQQPVAEVADGQRGDRRKGRCVVAVDDQAGHLVVLVGNHGLVEELLAAARRRAPSAPRSSARRCRPRGRRDGRRSAAGSPWRAGRADRRTRRTWHRWFGDRPWRLRVAASGPLRPVARQINRQAVAGCNRVRSVRKPYCGRFSRRAPALHPRVLTR